ncbi:MAG: hypothetical protein WCF94_04290 [bacterium]
MCKTCGCDSSGSNVLHGSNLKTEDVVIPEGYIMPCGNMCGVSLPNLGMRTQPIPAVEKAGDAPAVKCIVGGTVVRTNIPDSIGAGCTDEFGA